MQVLRLSVWRYVERLVPIVVLPTTSLAVTDVPVWNIGDTGTFLGTALGSYPV